MAQLNYTPARVEVKLNSRGKYTWTIELPLTPNASFAENSEIPVEINQIDKKLRELFPMNTAEIGSAGRTRFSPVDDLDE